MPQTLYGQLYDPLILYSRAIVTPGAGAGPNVAALVNPHGLPMELLEVRFRVFPNVTVADQFESITGMSVGVKMDLGSIPIVDADVPVGAFGTAREADESQDLWQIATDGSVGQAFAIPSSYRWRLKYPLHIPAGCVLTPVFTHLGQTHLSVTVDTAFIARSLPLSTTLPAQMQVPWVGSYNSVSFDNLASEPAGNDFSSELDIVNPFAQQLELARMVGTCAGVFGSSDGTEQNVEVGSAHRFQYGKVRARARSGDEIARSPTPFSGLFPYSWRAWDIPGGWFMQPGEFYKVQLTVDQTIADVPADDQKGSVQYSVAAIGFRKLPQAVFLAAAKGAA